jgi:hypothetical protein
MHAVPVTRLRLRDRIRRLPAGEVIVHTAVFLLGAAFIALGFALVVLPGPLTIPPIIVGLLIWSLEFDFAEKWLRSAQDRAQAAWDQAKARPWTTGVVSGGGILGAVVLAVFAVRGDWIPRLLDSIT